MKRIVCLLVVMLAVSRAGAVLCETFIGTNAIPVIVMADTQTRIETNRIAGEFTAYFGASSDICDFFWTNGMASGQSVQIEPAGHDGGPLREIASDIRYFGPPNAKIVVGSRALEWLLGQMEAAAPFTNTWPQAEALLSGLRTGSITNDMQTCRESFMIEGVVCTNADEDAQMVTGIASYWSRLHYSSPNVLGFRTGRISENGPELPALFCRCTDPGSRSGSLFPIVLVYFENRWRLLLQ